MRLLFLFLSVCIAGTASAGDAGKLWKDLRAKRDGLAAWHQEFEVTQAYKTDRNTQEGRRDVVIDMSQGLWREESTSGAGDHIQIFDGDSIYSMDARDDEYIRIDRKGKDDPQPGPYRMIDLDWDKAKELERRPCGFSDHDHTCVVLEVPAKMWMRLGHAGQVTRMPGGFSRMALDTETGLMVQSVMEEVIDNGRNPYRFELTYGLKKFSDSTAANANLFKVPDGLHEVKKLTPWDATRIKKELAGKPAPELEVTDLSGNPVTLSSLKGKTVLLDFWATWCPPCVADGPALDKLYRKFGDKNLTVVGLSVNEEREVVEKFLKKHPHEYPVVLTTENEMPRPYQVGIFPTYMIIGADGTLVTAMEGDQGFGELRKYLEKAGMAAD